MSPWQDGYQINTNSCRSSILPQTLVRLLLMYYLDGLLVPPQMSAGFLLGNVGGNPGGLHCSVPGRHLLIGTLFISNPFV